MGSLKKWRSPKWDGLKTSVKSFVKNDYVQFTVLLAVCLTLFSALIPNLLNSEADKVRALVAAFIFGGLVGAAEVASRYRDEPLMAVKSPYGLVYIFLNGYLSILAFFLILEFPNVFGAVAGNKFLAALVAGFGSSVVMRSRIALIKGADGKDESIGPDYVIKVLLRIVDNNIDRRRSVRRQAILSENIEKIHALGDLEAVWQYLFSALTAFQNIDEVQKKALYDTYNDYRAQDKLPSPIKKMALGFIYLTLVGEENFKSLLDNAEKLAQSGKLDLSASKAVAEKTGPPPKPPSPFDSASEQPSAAATPAEGDEAEPKPDAGAQPGTGG
jgi:hypothetical protein